MPKQPTTALNRRTHPNKQTHTHTHAHTTLQMPVLRRRVSTSRTIWPSLRTETPSSSASSTTTPCGSSTSRATSCEREPGYDATPETGRRSRSRDHRHRVWADPRLVSVDTGHHGSLSFQLGSLVLYHSSGGKRAILTHKAMRYFSKTEKKLLVKFFEVAKRFLTVEHHSSREPRPTFRK